LVSENSNILKVKFNITCLINIRPPSPVARLAGSLIVKILLLPAQHACPAAFRTVLEMLKRKILVIISNKEPIAYFKLPNSTLLGADRLKDLCMLCG
jgi:hypothetical protein